MPKTLLILNDPPYGTERSYNALRLAGSLSKREGEDVKVFLIGDAASCAKKDQKVPQAPALVPGLAEAGHNFYTRAGAESLWNALQDLKAGRIIVLTAAPAYKCPAAPYEGAMLIDDWVRKRGLRERCRSMCTGRSDRCRRRASS